MNAFYGDKTGIQMILLEAIEQRRSHSGMVKVHLMFTCWEGSPIAEVLFQGDLTIKGGICVNLYKAMYLKTYVKAKKS